MLRVSVSGVSLGVSGVSGTPSVEPFGVSASPYVVGETHRSRHTTERESEKVECVARATAVPASTSPRKPLPPVLPQLEPSPELVAALAMDTGVPAAVVRGWLGGQAVAGHVRDVLLESLWAPIGGWK
jgi:hypothetical protein